LAPSLATATPGGVSDLRVTATSDSKITIQWTQVDDGTGKPASYRVKYSPPPIDWKTATIGCDRTIYGTAIGAPMQCTITGLQPGSTYEIQLMSFRIVNGSWQGAKYSNVARGTTLGSSPPRVVTDLSATDVDPTEIDLSWTQVDDGTGYPAWYRVKYSTPPIDWKTATVGCNVRGDRIGWPISCTIVGLTPGTAYEIQLMSYKLVNGTWTNARYSNVLSVTTPAANSSFVSIAQRTNLQPLPGATDAVGADVNRHGVVVGTSGGRPVVWENGTPRELPVISGSSGTSASSINDAGEIAGATTLSNGDVRVVLWKNGTVTQIGTLPGYRHSHRPHINSSGAIVGIASDAVVNFTKRVGFYWENGAMTALPQLTGHTYSMADGSNSAGLIIGRSYGTSYGTFVIWNRAGTIVWTAGVGDPNPVPDGNEIWIGISDASDGFFRNTDVGGLWRWRAGQVAGWPGSEHDADGRSVSVGGLVLGITMDDWDPLDRGVWNSAGQFFAFDDQSASCFDISDGYVLCGQQGFGTSWIAKLDFS